MYELKESSEQKGFYEVVNPDTSEITLQFLYMKGYPKNYHASCKDGKFKVKGLADVETLEITPIAWRFFEDTLFKDKAEGKKRKWVEIFFIDKDGCLSVTAFHGFSVQALEKEAGNLFYMGKGKKGLNDCKINISFQEKTNAKKDKFFIAKFSINLLEDETQSNILKSIALVLKPYRAETLQPTAIISAEHCYPVQLLPLAQTSDDEDFLEDEKVAS